MVAKTFNMTTSSSSSDFSARNLAHLRSKQRREAQVSASKGVSTAAQRAKSQAQSSFNKVLAFSNKLMCLFSIATLVAGSIARIVERVGPPFGVSRKDQLLDECLLCSLGPKIIDCGSQRVVSTVSSRQDRA